MSYSYVYKSKSEQWRQRRSVQELPQDLMLGDAKTVFIYFVLFVVGAYYFLRSSSILPPNAFRRFFWRLFVYSLPPSLVLALEKRISNRMETAENIETYSHTRTFGAKSKAVWRILGLGSGTYMQNFLLKPTGSTVQKVKQATLPGLLNRDNECYQNSVIQGFAALSSFVKFLNDLPSTSSEESNLKQALHQVLEQLNDPEQCGQALWTPWRLKNMSSWQQQDAQEYFSKVVDELEKDITKSIHNKVQKGECNGLGCLSLVDWQDEYADKPQSTSKIDGPIFAKGTHDEIFRNQLAQNYIDNTNPLEGLLAQRVGCLRCGFVEGLTLIPFNCLTVSLGRVRSCDLESCLDNYCQLETIPGVECPCCSLLRHKRMYENGLAAHAKNNNGPQVKEYLQITKTRLQSVMQALEEQDFSEATLTQKCIISPKTRVTTDKTKQAVIARCPEALVLHVNRSVFNEKTGAQYKNLAAVRFPRLLDLDRWCLGSSANLTSDDAENWETNPSKSMILELDEDLSLNSPTGSITSQQASSVGISGRLYALRAVITHYGTHGDGHYITYRQSPQAVIEEDSRIWWRLSDDDVVEVDEDVVMNEGGVFMLFYERLHENDRSPMTRGSEMQSNVEPTTGQSKVEEVVFKKFSEQAALPHEPTDTGKSAIERSDLEETKEDSSEIQGIGPPRLDIPAEAYSEVRSESKGLSRNSSPATSQVLTLDPTAHNFPPSSRMKTAGELRRETVNSQGTRGAILQV